MSPPRTCPKLLFLGEKRMERMKNRLKSIIKASSHQNDLCGDDKNIDKSEINAVILLIVVEETDNVDKGTPFKIKA